MGHWAGTVGLFDGSVWHTFEVAAEARFGETAALEAVQTARRQWQRGPWGRRVRGVRVALFRGHPAGWVDSRRKGGASSQARQGVSKGQGAPGPEGRVRPYRARPRQAFALGRRKQDLSRQEPQE